MLRLWENPMLSIEDRLEAARGEIERVCAQRDAAANVIDELRADAERYRWLRESDFDIFGSPHAVDLSGKDLDAAIDEVMLKTPNAGDKL